MTATDETKAAVTASETPWTGGPWKVFTVQDGPNKGQLLGVGQQTGEGVTDAYGGLWGSGPEQMANAHLIAAAPKLYAALAEMVRVYADFEDGDGNPCPTVAAARAALHRANPALSAGEKG